MANLGRRGRTTSRQFDRLFAKVGLLVAVVLFPLRFLSQQLFIQVIPPLVGLACLLYLLAETTRSDQRAQFDHHRFAVDGHVVAGITVLAIGGLALVGGLSGGRTVPFLAVTGLVGTAILAQIIFLETNELDPTLVLVQLLAFALVVRFTALWSTPGLVGVDSWTHLTDYAAAIRAEDSLSAISAVKYRAAPLFHVLVVLAADAIGVGMRAATYATLGIAVPLSTLLVYAMAALVVEERWALLAAACFVMADHVVRWGVHIIPTSMGLVFFVGALLASMRLFTGDKRLATYALVAAFGVATALTHQVSAFILLVVLGVASVVQIAGRWGASAFRQTGSLWPLFVFESVFLAVLWSVTPYRDGVFMGELIDTVEETVATSVGFLHLAGPESTAPGTDAAAAAGTPIAIAFADALGLFTLFFVVVLGSLAALRRHNATPATVVLVATAVVLAVFTFGLPLFGFRTFLPGRWYAFMYVPMAIIAAMGCRFAIRSISPRRAITGLLLFALLFPGAMAINHKGTPDNPVFDQEYVRFAYEDSELAAVETVRETRPDGADPLYTDHPYRTVFERSGAAPANMLAIENGTIDHDTVVYRQYQSAGAPVVRTGNTSITHRVSHDDICHPSMHRLYTNGDVAVCTGIDGIDGE